MGISGVTEEVNLPNMSKPELDILSRALTKAASIHCQGNT